MLIIRVADFANCQMCFLAVHVCRLFMNCSENIKYFFTLFIWPFLLVGLRICVDCQIDKNKYIFFCFVTLVNMLYFTVLSYDLRK